MCYENENRNLRSTFKNELDFECSFYAIYNKMFRILIEVKSNVWINLCSAGKSQRSGSHAKMLKLEHWIEYFMTKYVIITLHPLKYWLIKIFSAYNRSCLLFIGGLLCNSIRTGTTFSWMWLCEPSYYLV